MIEQKEPENNAVQVLHRDLSTQSQLGMLLSVSSHMMSFLSAEQKAETEGFQPGREEAHIAAENTLMTACDRIDQIIKDDKRWGLEFQTRLEALFEKNTKIAQEVAEKQKKLIEEATAREGLQKEAAIREGKPHVRFRPALFSMPDHTWVAYLGDPADLSSGIMGSGPSPAAALESFDLAFAGQLTQEQEQTIPLIQHEHKSLDLERNGVTDDPDKRGEVAPRNIEGTGPQL